ncbi:TrkH family potassium uptake protein [Bacteroides propionicifaciens]|uniref:TrkH family potassium uptake protein n=1 Tax=Bacteroides propionicifaciens TaxID=392838 RepID=UPI00036BE1F3|nr:potassium transporter TrkG [Bacteroides propionicifaciens]
MKIYNKLLLYQNKFLIPYINTGLKILGLLAGLASVVFILAFIYRYGYDLNEKDIILVNKIYRAVWLIFLVDVVLHMVLNVDDARRQFKKTTWTLSVLLLLTLVPVVFDRPAESGGVLLFWDFTNSNLYRYGLLFLFSFFNLSSGLIRLLGKRTNPSLMLAGSFIVIIIVGSLLLKLPTATINGIDWIDSIFLSTSAVCVTGLTPIDIPATLTPVGMTIVIILIQIGGLGVMTFTSFFALFFMGNTSLYNQVVVRDMVSSNSLGSLLSTLLYILVFTLVIEGIGAFSIWMTIHGTLGMDMEQEIAFSVFHSISAFCNAGFSTLADGLGDVRVYHQNGIYIVISVLIILGGIGFPILVNFKDALITKVKRMIAYFRHSKPPYIYRLYSLNTRIVLYLSLGLILFGTIMMSLLEWNGVLAGMPLSEKITKALFLSINPRSAGFSSVDINDMRFHSCIIFFVLMWIGGAAQSTAGGVKVNTLAVLLLNFRSVLRRSDRIEVFGREISNQSVNRAHATVFISLGVLFIASFLLTLFEPDTSPLLLIYECVAAMSTCGAGLGITHTFDNPAKGLLIILMFIGRVGIITIMMGAVKNRAKRNCHFPVGDIIIN